LTPYTRNPERAMPSTSLTKPATLGTLCFGLGFASIAASIATWANAQGNGTTEEIAHAERFGIFIGLWAPTFFILADQLARRAGAPPATGGAVAAHQGAAD
jgi:hypothetical protein